MTGPTLREVLADAVQRLRAAGVEDPGRDARLLLAGALGLRGSLAAADPARTITADEAAAVGRHVAARAARQPVSQILGRRAFWGRDFIVTPDTLDPRPDTETLVEVALAAPFARVLDLGTGTGCLLLTLLAERPGATGLGTDVSPAALEVARRNAAALGLTDRADLAIASWFEGVGGNFDLIVSNPPYIAAAEMAGLAPEVRDWEPRGALTDEGDGLGAYRAIATGAAAHLVPGGRIAVEIGLGQEGAVAGFFRAAGLAGVATHHDLTGRVRVVSARRE